jgi:hypothetical protein
LKSATKVKRMDLVSHIIYRLINLYYNLYIHACISLIP